MIEVAVIVHSLYTWAALCGIFLGLSIAQLTIFPSRTANPLKSRRRRPTKIFLALSAAVLSATAGLFLSEPEVLRDPGLPWAFGTALVLGGLGTRFKRAAGIPILFLAVGISALSFYILDPWEPVMGKTTLCSLKILRLSGGEITATVSVPGGEESILNFNGDALDVSVQHLFLARPYELLGRKTSFAGIAVSDSKGSGSRTIPEKQKRFLEDFLLTRSPGVQKTEKHLVLENLKLYSTYLIFFDETGNLASKIE